MLNTGTGLKYPHTMPHGPAHHAADGGARAVTAAPDRLARRGGCPGRPDPDEPAAGASPSRCEPAPATGIDGDQEPAITEFSAATSRTPMPVTSS